MGFENTFQHFSALRRLGIGHPHAWNVETLLRVPFRVAIFNAESRLRNKPKTSPLKVRTQLKNLCHRLERRVVPFPRHYALVLVLDPGFVRLSWRRTITMDCRISSGSKPETATGFRSFLAIHS